MNQQVTLHLLQSMQQLCPAFRPKRKARQDLANYSYRVDYSKDGMYTFFALFCFSCRLAAFLFFAAFLARAAAAFAAFPVSRFPFLPEAAATFAFAFVFFSFAAAFSSRTFWAAAALSAF